MKKILIGIAGKAGVGKDTVAGIINYIFKVGKSKANYRDWIMHRRWYEFELRNPNVPIIHFGDSLKQVSSDLLNIELRFFHSREHKDNLWYSLKERGFLDASELNTNKKHYVPVTDLSTLKNYTDIKNDKYPVFKLRTLLQYVGTDLCRNQLYDTIWVDKAIYNARELLVRFQYAIIADMRFQTELDAINRVPIKKLTIKIERLDIENTDTHSSENINFECDTTIINDGNLNQLFYKVLNIINDL